MEISSKLTGSHVLLKPLMYAKLDYGARHGVVVAVTVDVAISCLKFQAGAVVWLLAFWSSVMCLYIE